MGRRARAVARGSGELEFGSTLRLPIWVSAPSLKTADGIPFNRLMIAQDTGSAIRGPVRGDIFWGTGAEAGRIAGETNQPCDFCILIPN
jgi:membrane-bound lytic murein transglycosylase A